MTDTELGEALERVTSWLRRAHPPREWNAVALSTLDALARSGPRRVTELTAQERITQPGMTGLVGRLAAAGLVERNPDPRDGRATLVAITAQGREYVGAFHAGRAATVAAQVRRLPPQAQEALAAAAGALALLADQDTHIPEEVSR